MEIRGNRILELFILLVEKIIEIRQNSIFKKYYC